MSRTPLAFHHDFAPLHTKFHDPDHFCVSPADSHRQPQLLLPTLEARRRFIDQIEPAMADRNNRADDSQEQRDTQPHLEQTAIAPYSDPSEVEYLVRGVGQSFGQILGPNSVLGMEPYLARQSPAISPAYTESFSRTTYHGPRSEHRAQPPMLGMTSPSMPLYPPPRQPAPGPTRDTHSRYSRPYADAAPTSGVNGAYFDQLNHMPREHGRTVTQRSLRVARAIEEAGYSIPRILDRTTSRLQSTQNNVRASSGSLSTQGAIPQGFAPHPSPGMSNPMPQAMAADTGSQLDPTRRQESLSRANRGQVVPDVFSIAMRGQHIALPSLTGGSSTQANERVVGEEWSRSRERATYDHGSSRVLSCTEGTVASENTGGATRSNATAEYSPFTATRERIMLQHLARMQSYREMANIGLQDQYPEAPRLNRPARLPPPRAQVEHYTVLTPAEVSEDPGCSICQNLYDTEHTAIRLQNVSCTHVFCLDCLQKWINSGMANAHHCPSCRQSISGALARQEPRRVALPAEMSGWVPPRLVPELTPSRPLAGVLAPTSRARAETMGRQLGDTTRDSLRQRATDRRYGQQGAPLGLPWTPRPASPPLFGRHQSLFDPGEEESAMRRSRQAPSITPNSTHDTLSVLFTAHAQQRAEFNSEASHRLDVALALGADEYIATSARIGRERTAMMARQEGETRMALPSLPYPAGMPGPRLRRE
ncbi:hypothetical protein BKA63DRAFT_135543 [Paraphoma chrysanthemicola]|nr:hypothetical protein BKA63DRAFT_135543 [Paraphoma chrysanthemicola]